MADDANIPDADTLAAQMRAALAGFAGNTPMAPKAEQDECADDGPELDEISGPRDAQAEEIHQALAALVTGELSKAIEDNDDGGKPIVGLG